MSTLCRLNRVKCDECEYLKHFNKHCFSEDIKVFKFPEYIHFAVAKNESLKKIKPKKIKEKTKRQKVYDKGKGKCYLCDKPLSFKDMTIDHVTPKSKGGSDNLKNLMPTHFVCNNKKGNKII